MSSQKNAASASLVADEQGAERPPQPSSSTAAQPHGRMAALIAAYPHAMLTVARCSAVLAAVALPYSSTATNVFFGLAFLAWLLSGRLFELIRMAARHPVAQGAVFLLFFAMAGVLWSDASAAQSADAIAKYRKLLLLVVLLPILDTPFWRRAVIGAFIASLTLLLLISYGIFAGLPFLPEPDPAQGAVFRRNHITHGFLMAWLAIAGAIIAATTSRSWLRAAAVLVIVLALVNGLAMTYARTGYLIFAALLLWLLAKRFGAKGMIAALAIIVATATVSYVAVPSVQNRVDQTFSETQHFAQGDLLSSTGIRLHYYRRGVQIFRDHPWIGAGTGSWPIEYERRSANDPLPLRHISGMGNPHSEYLLTAVQWGALGLLLHLAALIGLLRAAARLPTRRAWLARGTVVAFAVGSLFNSFFWDATEGHALVLTLAALYGGTWPPDEVDL
jgi:O-antigen ligase